MRATGLDSKQSWKVVAACFFIKFFSYGVAEICGVFMVATMSWYSKPRQEASLPFTLVYVIRNGSGPLIAYLGSIFGTRHVTLCGCICTSIAFGACFFAHSILILTIVFGIIYGLSFACETLLINAIIIEHFEKDISKGIAGSTVGAHFGVFFFSTVVGYLDAEYGLLGTFLIIAGIILNSIPAAFVVLLNQPKETTHNQLTPTKFESPEIHSNIDKKLNLGKLQDIQKLTELEKGALKYDDSHRFTTNKLSLSIIPENKEVSSNRKSPNNIFTELNVSDSTSENTNYCKKDKYGRISSRSFSGIPSRTLSGPASRSLSDAVSPEIIHKPRSYSLRQRPTISKYKDLLNLQLQTNASAILVPFKSPRNSFDSANLQELFQLEHQEENRHLQEQNSKREKPILVRLFGDPIFILLLVSGGIYYYNVASFLTILVDFAIDIGVDPSDARYFAIWAPVAEMTGSFFLGWIADGGYVSSNCFTALSFAGEGVAFILLIWCRHYIFYGAVILLFEWSQAGITMIFPAVVADTLDKEMRSFAIASMFLLASPLSLTISPLIGYFRDKGGSYTGMFAILAVVSFVGSLCHVYIQKLYRKRQNAECK